MKSNLRCLTREFGAALLVMAKNWKTSKQPREGEADYINYSTCNKRVLCSGKSLYGQERIRHSSMKS